MNMRQRLWLILVVVVAVVLILIIKPRDPCTPLRADRDRNTSVIALEPVGSSLARYAMDQNASLYAQMMQMGCRP